MLELNNIEVTYMDVVQVLRGLSLTVGEGQIVTLLGANGTGKTTTLKAISGLLELEEGKVSHGSVKFNGERIDNKPAEYISNLGIIQVMEGRKIFEHLSVKENLSIGAYLCNDKDEIKKRFDMIFRFFPRLKQFINRTSGYLSGGEQQMLVMGMALMAGPKLMLLDEPSLGLAPILVQEIFEIIQRINAEKGISILLVEQNAEMALNIAKYGYVIENGKVVLEGPSEVLINNEDVKEFYLGLSRIGKKRFRDVKHYKRRKRWLG